MIGFIIGIITTILAEFTVISLFIKKDFPRILFYSALINSFTFPLANYAYHNILNNFLAIEILVMLAESVLIVILFRMKYPKSLLISLAANAVTASISILLLL
jgi:hypothetical protein